MTRRDAGRGEAAKAAEGLLDSAEGLVDAAVALCAVKIEAAGKGDWRRVAVLRSLANAVEIPYDAGDLGTAASMALMVIATLSPTRRAGAARAVAAVLGGGADAAAPTVTLRPPSCFKFAHPN